MTLTFSPTGSWSAASAPLAVDAGLRGLTRIARRFTAMRRRERKVRCVDRRAVSLSPQPVAVQRAHGDTSNPTLHKTKEAAALWIASSDGRKWEEQKLAKHKKS
jgi:hypothetical protein